MYISCCWVGVSNPPPPDRPPSNSKCGGRGGSFFQALQHWKKKGGGLVAFLAVLPQQAWAPVVPCSTLEVRRKVEGYVQYLT